MCCSPLLSPRFSRCNHMTRQHNCDGCAVLIHDYDDDPDLFTDDEGQIFCEKCQAAHMADGLFMAQQFGAEMRHAEAVAEYLRPIEAMIDAADMARKRVRGE